MSKQTGRAPPCPGRVTLRGARALCASLSAGTRGPASWSGPQRTAAPQGQGRACRQGSKRVLGTWEQPGPQRDPVRTHHRAEAGSRNAVTPGSWNARLAAPLGTAPQRHTVSHAHLSLGPHKTRMEELTRVSVF